MFVVQINSTFDPCRTRYVRVYKTGKVWVERMHAKTATQFATEQAARDIIARFNLDGATTKARIVRA